MNLPKNKVLLRRNTEVLVGDWIAEVNRFTKEYTIYRIEEITNNGRFFYGKIQETTRDRNSNSPKTIGFSKDAHTVHTGCVWLTYLLPTARVLYGR